MGLCGEWDQHWGWVGALVEQPLGTALISPPPCRRWQNSVPATSGCHSGVPCAGNQHSACPRCKECAEPTPNTHFPLQGSVVTPLLHKPTQDPHTARDAFDGALWRLKPLSCKQAATSNSLMVNPGRRNTAEPSGTRQPLGQLTFLPSLSPFPSGPS